MILPENKLEEVKTEMHHQNVLTVYTPIQIMLNLFGDNETIAEPVLEDISVDLIKYIRHYYIEVVPEGQDKLKQSVGNLLDMLKTALDCVWRALGSLLSNEIR
jgi:hypothetical protein